MSSTLRFVAVSVLASIVVAGCAVANDPPAPEAESAEGELTGSCQYPRRYVAVVTEGECAEVLATRGRWVPSPLFEDAPEGSGACVYTWEGERYARVDREALKERFHPFYSGALTPLCASADGVPQEALVEELPFPIVTGQAGAVGCDVCGILKDGRLWAVLPPEDVLHRQFSVRLSSGGERSFQIRTDASARAVSVTLPPPPAGTSYVEGRIAVH